MNDDAAVAVVELPFSPRVRIRMLVHVICTFDVSISWEVATSRTRHAKSRSKLKLKL